MRMFIASLALLSLIQLGGCSGDDQNAGAGQQAAPDEPPAVELLSPEGEAVLSKEAKAKMFTPHVPEDEEGSSHYGYGWAIFETPRDTRLIAHNGGNGIFHADFRRYVDDGVVLIIGSNRHDFRSIPAVGPITRLIFDADYSAPPAVVRLPPAVPARHAGSYALPSGGKIRVTPAESSSGWPGVTLIPEGKDAFQVLGGGLAAGMADREKRLMAAYEQTRKGEYGPLAEVFGVPPAEVAGMHRRSWSVGWTSAPAPSRRRSRSAGRRRQRCSAARSTSGS